MESLELSSELHKSICGSSIMTLGFHLSCDLSSVLLGCIEDLCKAFLLGLYAECDLEWPL